MPVLGLYWVICARKRTHHAPTPQLQLYQCASRDVCFACIEGSPDMEVRWYHYNGAWNYKATCGEKTGDGFLTWNGNCGGGGFVATIGTDIELDPSFDADLPVDVMELKASGLLAVFGRPDFVWASPPCTAFSVASIGHHWTGGRGAYVPKTERAVVSIRLVEHTLRLIEELQPRCGWIMENPRGVLRKLPVVAGMPRSTVTYCQFGDERMKPTDLWGGICGWLPDARCSNGDACHVRAPRGAKTGTQGLKGAKVRSMVPYGLSAAVADQLDECGGA